MRAIVRVMPSTADFAIGPIHQTEGADRRDVACIDIAMLKATMVDLGALRPGTYTISAGGEATPVRVVVS